MTKYNVEIDNKIVIFNMKRIVNQIYKLLPSREEGLDWETPLYTIIEELSGMSRLLVDQQNLYFPLLCKLEGLFVLINEEDFFQYRRTIFECLSLANNIMKSCQ